MNDRTHQITTCSPMPTKLPSNIYKFQGSAREDICNQWCSSKKVIDESFRLHLFQFILTKFGAKWYIDQPIESHAAFGSLEKVF